MHIECIECKSVKSYSEKCQCPNDVIEETKYIQDEEGNWVCPDCQ